MRALILAILALGAGFMGYLMLQDECAGGRVFANEAECRASGLSAEICHRGLSEGLSKARLEVSPFTTENDCALQFPRCQPHGRLAGYVPVPRGVCLVPGKPGEPVFERHGQRIPPR